MLKMHNFVDPISIYIHSVSTLSLIFRRCTLYVCDDVMIGNLKTIYMNTYMHFAPHKKKMEIQNWPLN